MAVDNFCLASMALKCFFGPLLLLVVKGWWSEVGEKIKNAQA